MADYIADYLNALLTGTEKSEVLAAFASLMGRGKPHVGFVAQGELPLTTSAGNKFLNFRRRRVAKTRIKAPRLILPNFNMSSSNEVIVSGTPILRGAFEQNGQTVPVTWSGAISVGVAGTGYFVSDPMEAVDIAAGTVFWERGYCQYPSGMPYGMQNGPNVSGGDCFEYGAAALTDRTAGTGSFASSDGTNSFATIGTVAMTCDPSFFFLGDSTFLGIGETLPSDDSGATGLTKVLAQFFGGFNAGVGSATAAGFVASNRSIRTALANTYASHLLQGHTLNMLGSTLAQMQADLLAERNLFPNLSAYMTTTPPSGTTTDGGVTVANQTPGANESKRVALNDWKRTAPEPWQGCVEVADSLEVNAAGVRVRNGGRYAPNKSADMLHPTTGGYQDAKQMAGPPARGVIAA